VKETCHNRKRKKSIVLVVLIKVVELVAEIIAQHVTPTIVPLRYPCITCSSYEHCAPKCTKKIEV
jgi:hypothetical protein